MDQPARKIGGQIIPMDAPSLEHGQQDCAYQRGSSIHAALFIFPNGNVEMGAESDQTATANFLWGSSGPNRKWALVKWEKACIPKIAGGIGIRDPEHSNSVMGAKIWWKWLTYPDTPWAQLWTAKYASNLPLEETIRMNEISKGSAMWNSAIKHRELIQNHSFWEVKEGSTARFWTDSWQQLPSIKTLIQGLQDQEINQQDKVSEFWKPNTDSDHREWKEIIQILPDSTKAIQLSLSEELKKRKILKEAGKDKLRWGYEEKGIFTAKEAYKIILKDRLTKKKVWEKYGICQYGRKFRLSSGS